MSDSKSRPDAVALAALAELEIYDAQGKQVKFGTLFADGKAVVVFIRHFLCCTCQAYVTAISRVATPARLQAADARLAVIGCGDPGFIPAYAEKTACQGAMYADPDRKVFQALGMNIESVDRTPAGQALKSYVPQNSTLARAAEGIAQAFKSPSLLGRQGKISQLGGEFVLGPGNVCSFASRMQHTEDHVEVAELLKEAGIEST